MAEVLPELKQMGPKWKKKKTGPRGGLSEVRNPTGARNFFFSRTSRFLLGTA
jgi:hypothetical protein